MTGTSNYEIVVGTTGGGGGSVVLTPGDTSDAQTVVELPAQTVGVPLAEDGSNDIVASGGTSPYTFSVSGNLPSGLEFTDDGVDTGRISGTPTNTGTFDFAVTATDATGAKAATAKSSFKKSVTKR